MVKISFGIENYIYVKIDLYVGVLCAIFLSIWQILSVTELHSALNGLISGSLSNAVT